jgi:cell division protein FtsB
MGGIQMQKRNKRKKSSTLKKILLSILAVYVVYVFIQQQMMLNSYKEQEKYYIAKINEEKAKAERLERLKTLYSTDLYIERIARDKLGFIKPGERVFIDISNR